MTECQMHLYVTQINTSRPVELLYTYFNQSGAYNCKYNRRGEGTPQGQAAEAGGQSLTQFMLHTRGVACFFVKPNLTLFPLFIMF